jgi:hypothetical protein
MLACYSGNLQNTAMLLQAGANIMAVNNVSLYVDSANCPIM